MKKVIISSLVLLNLLFFSQAVFAQGDVGVDATVDKENPTVNITQPSNGDTISGTITVTATASDDVAVSKVEFYVDGSLTATDTTFPYSFRLDTTTLSDGSHTIMAKAYDTLSNTSTNTITVTVDNSVPTIESPTKKIQEPVIGPPTIATKGPGKKTTLIQIPEDEGGLPFLRGNRDFWLGLAVGLEIIVIIFLIIVIKRSKKKTDV